MATAQGTLAAPALPKVERKQRNLWVDAWHRLLRNKLAVIGLTVVVILLGVGIFADQIAPYAYDARNRPVATNSLQPPTTQFWMGTDNQARDVLSRVIKGAQVSLLVGFVSQAIVLAIGVPLGLIAGYFGGRTDAFIMRFVDVMYAFPRLLFVLLIVGMLGPGLFNVFIAIGLTGWVTLARLVRGQVLSLRQKEFIEAARCVGASPSRTMIRHLLPNTLTPIIVALTFGIPEAIFAEAGLSFIGATNFAPLPSWGQMVGAQYDIRGQWWLAAFPAGAIGITMLAFTWLGDGLRDALDPKLR